MANGTLNTIAKQVNAERYKRAAKKIAAAKLVAF
jgi:hypothetical protein